MTKKRIQLGDEIEDVTAKIAGIAVAHIDYLDGSAAWLIQPTSDPDGELRAKVEVQEAYARWIGEGVRVDPKPPAGFHINEPQA